MAGLGVTLKSVGESDAVGLAPLAEFGSAKCDLFVFVDDLFFF